MSDLVEYGSPQWLANMLTAWLSAPHPDTDGQGDPVAELVVMAAGGDKLGWAPLSAAAVRDLGQALQRSSDEVEQTRRRTERAHQIASLLVDCRRAGDDVGELLVAALNRAGDQRGLGPVGLTMGRPGSWEAAVVRDWASAGWPIIPANLDRCGELTALFTAMADARDDGGDVVSWALGMAADQMGGAEQLAGRSPWLRSRGAYNMIVQYARPQGMTA